MNTIHKILTFIWALVRAALATTPPIRLANERVIGFANEARATDDWFLFAPIGDFPHGQGLQRVDEKAVQAMANEFKSLPAKLGRMFTGRPIWVGHHDLDPKEYPDSKAYGWITDAEARADGLWTKAKWTPQGKELVESGQYKFHSPYWEVDLIGRERGRNVYRPNKLLSAGLTNEPNISVPPLANEKEHDMDKAVLIAALGLAATATETDITTAITTLRSEAGKVTTLGNEKTTLANDKATAETTLANEKTAHTTTKTTLANVIAQRNKLALANAIKAGRITAAEEADWSTKLTADWDKHSAELATKKAAIKTESQLNGAGSRRTTLANTQAAAQFRDKVATKMANTKCSYEQAWNSVKAEEPALFEAMDAVAAE
jgi:hypothetical protein